MGHNTSKADKKIVIKRDLRFIDSFKFMASSIDSLLKNVEDHTNLNKFCSREQRQLFLKKGV
jgi:hypothetical protein